MKFTVFKKEFSKAQLRELPELRHFELSQDRWMLTKYRLLAVANLVAGILIFHLLYLGCMSLIVWIPDKSLIAGAYIGVMSLMYPIIVVLGSFIFPRWIVIRIRKQLGCVLQTRGIYYCPKFKCRYNCTGIRGNICPECGSEVPGLAPE